MNRELLILTIFVFEPKIINMYPIKFDPILKSTIWGGDKIIPFKNIDIKQEQVGESWEISDVQGDESVVSEGEYKGKRLSELVKEFKGKHFNKFIVFDEAHKYMDNKDLTGSIVTAIREMRHKGVSIMIASQDPPSLPNEIIELSSMVLLHKFNSPQWLKHIQKSVIQLSGLTPADMSILKPGEAFLWATKAGHSWACLGQNRS